MSYPVKSGDFSFVYPNSRATVMKLSRITRTHSGISSRRIGLSDPPSSDVVIDLFLGMNRDSVDDLDALGLGFGLIFLCDFGDDFFKA